MLSIEIPNKFKQEITVDIISDILTKLGITESYSLTYCSRNKGRYIILNFNSHKYFICFSSDGGRNSSLMQYVFPTYLDFLKDLSYYLDDKMYIYILPGTEKQIRTNYNLFFLRIYLTLGISIINPQILKSLSFNISTIIPFSNSPELVLERTKIRSKNLGNKSTFFNENTNSIEIYGKMFGANLMEVPLFCLVLKKISQKEIILYKVEDNNTKDMPLKYSQLISDKGVLISEDLKEMDNSDVNLDEISPVTYRDSPKFYYNLFKTFGPIKKCYFCGCDIPNLIIGAHIHRVTDIKNDSKLNIEEKKRQCVDSNNGFWLCSNHDKLFEFGLIYFSGKKMVISEKLKDDQKTYVLKLNKIISQESCPQDFEIKDIHYTKDRKSYLQLHLKRIMNQK